jgi:tRNA (guanine37-N1)-methyltransferase
MVLMCQPVFDALESVEAEQKGQPVRVLLTPQGERLNQRIVEDFARESWLVLICGHYEGFDERIRIGLGAREISIGDYVLTGGEPAAMVLIDAVVRLIPGVLGDEASADEDSFSGGLLEYPQYTRPREFRGMKVPEVLLSGDHGMIAAWRREQRLARTLARRPELLRPEYPEPKGSEERA